MNSSISRWAEVALRGDNRLDAPLVVQEELGRRQIEVDRAASAAPGVQRLEELGHRLQQRHQRLAGRAGRRIAVGQDGVHLAVRQARVAVDHPVVKLVSQHRPARIDLHQARLHEAIDSGSQAAHAGGERRRKHVDGAVRKIDGRAAVERGGVEGAPLRNVVRDVRDVHAEPVVAVRQALERHGVVEIPRRLAVDRHGLPAAEVAPPDDVARAHRRAGARGLGLGRGIVPVGQVMLADDQPRVHAGRVDVAEHLADAPDRAAGGGRPAGQLDGHHVAGRGGRRLAGRDVHVHDEPPIEREHVGEPGLVDRRSGRRDARRPARECARCVPRPGRPPSGCRCVRRPGRRASPGSGWRRRCRGRRPGRRRDGPA